MAAPRLQRIAIVLSIVQFLAIPAGFVLRYMHMVRSDAAFDRLVYTQSALTFLAVIAYTWARATGMERRPLPLILLWLTIPYVLFFLALVLDYNSHGDPAMWFGQ